MFNPPASPTNGSEYTYGNVVWQYQNPPGVWNIKDGTLVGTNGVGVSGFRIDGTDLKFYYVYPGGVTSSEINLGTVVGAGSSDPGITFNFPFNNSSDRITLGQTINIQATGSIRAFVENAGTNTFRIDNRIASVSVTGVAYYEAADFNVIGDGKVIFDPSRVFLRLGLGSQVKNNITMQTHSASSTLTLNPGSGLTASLAKSGTDNENHTFNISGITATNTQIGVASFRAGDFTVTSGQVSLTGGLVNSVNGRTGSVALPLARTDGTTGVASFKAGDFTVSTAGEVGLTSNIVNSVNGMTGALTIATGTGFAAAVNASKTVTLYANTATYSGGVLGSASFNSNDFTVVNGAVSLTSAAFVRQINGATGNLLVGAGDDRIVFTNPTGLSANTNFLFDGNTLTFGGPNTRMTVTGPTFAFGDNTTVQGGIFNQFSERATPLTDSGDNIIEIGPLDGMIQKITRTNTTAPGLTIKPASSGWSTVPNTVQTIVVYLQQVGTSYTGQFDGSVLTDRSVTLFGVTAGVDVFTLTRYAVTASTGLTMGFSIAVGLTAAGVNF